MKKPPKDCTCIWTQWETGGAIYIAGSPCPAQPHPRTYSVGPEVTP